MLFKVIFTALHVSQDRCWQRPAFSNLQKNHITLALLIVKHHYIGFVNGKTFSTLNLRFCQHFDDSSYWSPAAAFSCHNEMWWLELCVRGL